VSDRLRLLGDAVDTIYDVISFGEGGEPDWKGMDVIFHPNARLTRITPEGIDYFDLRSFQAMAMEMLNRGVYTSFFQREIERRAEIFGSLAHVLSAYETKQSPDARSSFARGVNSIQLLWEATSWRVLSLVWDEETEREHLDVAQLFGRKGAHV